MNNCLLCNGSDIEIIYNGYLRTGSFGNVTSKKYDLFSCKNCSAKYIENILARDYYEEPTYREDYNGTLDVQKFYKEYDINDTNKISKIGLQNLRGKVVADFGTAAGTFLQAIQNISKFTVAIEPSKHFHKSLAETSKYVFSYGKDLLTQNIKVDVATSFDVIEHVALPIEYLKEIYLSLDEKGTLYLKTPNFDEILHALIPEKYDAFNYRTAHLYYFDAESLSYILKEAGFKDFKISYMHDYDISNLLYWMKESKPTGIGKSDLFDTSFNQVYKSYLEQIGKASHLWVEAKK